MKSSIEIKHKIGYFKVSRKRILIFAFLLIALAGAYPADTKAQYLSVTGIDTSLYPEMSAKFYMTRADGKKETNISIADMLLTENDRECRIIDIEMPADTARELISAVLTIDVSGSMSGPPLNMARQAAYAWINALPDNGSECALTTFTQKNLILQDFTPDKDLLKQKIAGLTASGGTSFNAACIDSLSGGLLAAQRGENRKVMVLITDGSASGNEQAIIDKALAIDCRIYAVSLGQNCPKILRNISTATGGKWFDGVVDEAGARRLFTDILSDVGALLPATVRWEAQDCDKDRTVVLSDTTKVLSDTSFYSASDELLPKIDVEPEILVFEKQVPPTVLSGMVTISGKNREILIDSIISSSPNFSVSDFGGSPTPFIQAPGEQRELTVSGIPSDTLPEYVYFTIYSNACDLHYIPVYTGDPADGDIGSLNISSPPDTSVHIYGIGSDTVVTWEGVLPGSRIRLDYSQDAGKTWHTIADSAHDLKYSWTDIPAPESDSCLLKAEHIITSGDSSFVIDCDTTENFFEISCPAFYITSDSIGLGSSEVVTWEVFFKSRFFQNSSDFPVVIQDVVATGPDSAYFFVNVPVTPDTLQPGGVENLEITFMPDSVRDYRTTLQIIGPCRTQETEITASAVEKKLTLLADIINFGEVCTGESRDTTLTLIENTGKIDITVTGAQLFIGDTLSFDIQDGAGTVVLSPGEKLEYTIDFDAGDIGLTSCEMRISHGITKYETVRLYGESTECIPEDIPNITFPNGGERIPIACDTLVTWAGIPSYQKVRIDFSRNGGSSWQTIAETAGYHSWIWNDVPGPASGDCLIRLTTLSADSAVDVSDAPFSIVCPDVSAPDSIGFESPLAGINMNFEDLLTSGDFVVTVGNMYFEGGDESYFALPGKTSFVMAENSGRDIEIDFAPDAMRNYKTTLIIETECQRVEIDINAEVKEKCLNQTNTIIEFGQVILSYNKSGRATILKNCGNVDVEIDSLVLGNNLKNQFYLPSQDTSGFTLPAGSDYELDASYTAKILGHDTSRVLIFSEARVDTVLMTAESVLDSTISVDNIIDEIDFGSFLIGLGKDTADVPAIKNASAIEMTVERVYLRDNVSGAFDLLKPETSGIALKKDSVLNVDVQYTATVEGTETAQIVFEYDGGRQSIVNLIGEANKAAPAEIPIFSEKLTGQPGNRISIPIYIELTEPIMIDIEMTGKLAYTLLPLVPADSGSIISDEIVYTPIKSETLPKDTTGIILLTEIDAEIVLGKRKTSKIYFDNLLLNYPGTRITGDTNYFNISGLCYEGGERIIGVHDNSQGIIDISPVPTRGNMTLKWAIIEKTNCEISITSISGKTCETILDRIVEPGIYEKEINLSRYSGGMYFVVFKTRAVNSNYPIIIEK